MAGLVCVATDSYNGWCHRRQNRRLCSRPHSCESVIFSYFWHSYFLHYGHFVEYMNMHAMNMWLTDAATVVVGEGWGADWTLRPWRHNNAGGVTAGQARHN